MCKMIAVTNRALCPGDFLEQIRVLGRAGADRIVLREKDLSEEEYVRLAEKVLSVCGDFGTECVLHQNIGAAERLGVRRIHLSAPAVEEHRERLQGFSCVGVSTHSTGQLALAEDCGVDYVFYGHVFATACKAGAPPRGLSGLREICGLANVPVYAIGGISPENAASAVEAGAEGVCVMSWGMQRGEDEIRRFVEYLHNLSA